MRRRILRVFSWRSLSALFVLLVLLLGCSAQREAAARGGSQQTTTGLPRTPYALPLDVAQSAPKKRAHSDNSLTAPSTLSLEELAPLLSAPELEQVQAKLDADQFKPALQLYREALAGPLAELAGDPRYLLQLGRLADLAEEYAASADAYAKSAEQSWVLTGYAKYFEARSKLRAGKAEAALDTLSNLPRSRVFSPAAEMLRAEAALVLKQSDLAIASLKAHLAHEPPAVGWPRAALLLGKELLQRGNAVAALDEVRKVSVGYAGSKIGKQAGALEQEILGALTPDEFKRHQALTAEQQLVRLRALVGARRFGDAKVVADELLGLLKRRRNNFSELGCETRFLRNKALFGTRKYTQAVDGFADVLRHCHDPELRPKALYLAGKYAAADKRYSQAIKHFGELERNFKSHRLADDARLRAARSSLELGDEANFTRLLSRMAEDYPRGDMVLDGVFQLALRRIERNDWAGAAAVLERGMKLAKVADVVRDHEWAGRERYFLARAWMQTGERERGLQELENLIRQRPLSYYTQHAYSRLLEIDRGRALAARNRAIAETQASPFTFSSKDFARPAFQRAVSLLRQGELRWAERELQRIETDGDAATDLLWSMALLYDRAGSPTLSHRLARGKLTDWLSKWPVGEWEKAWHVAFPRPYRPIVQKAAKRYELPESMIYAVMREESGFEAKVVSHAGAFGLMQIIKPTAKHYGKKAGLPYSESALKTPRVNIPLGASVLKDFQGYFPNNPLLGVPAYNAGPGRPKRWKKQRENSDFDVWVELIPFRETRRYTKRVLASRGAYAFLYESRDSINLLLPEKLK